MDTLHVHKICLLVGLQKKTIFISERECLTSYLPMMMIIRVEMIIIF